MKLRSALLAGLFAAIMASQPGCPCGIAGIDNNVPGAETFYFCGSPEPG